ncbi:MAG TPA: response regulator [Steroidobacteraceae bacterium]|jgi:PAS domain S-box-containing protein
MSAGLSSELVRRALESSPDAMIIIDATGTIIFANQRLFQVFGYERVEIVGRPVEVLVPVRFREKHVGHRSNFAKEQRARPMGVSLELLGLRKDGSEFPVEISLSPIQDREDSLVAASIRDISERRRQQQDLIEAREQADRANRAKSRFLAMASHDLRQPLQALALLNGTLRRLNAPSSGTDEALEAQSQAIGTMSRLLNALLDVSRLEAGAVLPNPIDFPLGPMLEELEQEFTTLAATNELQLQVTRTDTWVHSDPAMIGRILRNLVSNAIKYTERGTVRLAAGNGTHGVWIEVADTGIGIPADQLPLIYDEFYQAQTHRDPAHVRGGSAGYGLGLSIVRRLVDLLGIRLQVASEVGRGTTFALDLPGASAPHGGSESPAVVTPARFVASARLEPQAASSRQTARVKAPAEPEQVFVIDDNSGVRDSLCMLLEAAGFRVTALGSAARFLETYDPNLRGCLVLDVNMPGLTGLELQQRLNLRGATIPVLFMTGHADVSMAVEAMQQGASDFLQKPFRDTELLAAVRRALEKDRAIRSGMAAREVVLGRWETLTAREREVLGLVVTGKANKVMAGDLGVSQRTIEVHRARVMEKMGAASLAHLVQMHAMLDEAASR